MSEYGSGLTFGQTRNMDKERIKHALRGELMCGEDENGLVYAKATPEECAAYILSAYDDCVYHAKQAMDSGRALERLMKGKGVECTPEEYGALMEAARLEFDDYQYEKPDNDSPIGFDETPPEKSEIAVGVHSFPCLDHTPRTIRTPLTNGGMFRSLDNHQLAQWFSEDSLREQLRSVEQWLDWFNQPCQMECFRFLFPTGGGHEKVQ